MRFDIKDLVIKIETTTGARVLGFEPTGAEEADKIAQAGCEHGSDCTLGSACRIFTGRCHITACRETTANDRDRKLFAKMDDLDELSVLRELLLEAVRRLEATPEPE